ncbi:MAG: protein kinase, partial [Anaerolinea sp.]
MDVGTVIGEQYTIVEHIGRGGMADVWSARDARLRRMVAIKTIAVGLTQEIDPVKMFRSEAQTIASMEHPHILPIYDFGEHAGKLYIVMRFVTGGSLERLITGPMPPEEVLRIGEAIASALDYAHQNKVIHLDLKPPNILMDSVGSPYLADFGLATVLDPEGRARNPGSGTLLYMAPEQLTSEIIDRRADIYSFGVMMYHMLTGKLPFDGMIPLALRQIQFGDVLPALSESVPTLPDALSEVLRQATAKDPNQRPPSLNAVVDRMRAILQPGAVAGVGIALDTEERALLDAVSVQTERLIALGDRDLLEAVDIYTRARHNWAGGQGRFLVSLTHFLIMSSYYQDAWRYGLPVDRMGYQMLLRGALEYDTDLDVWWSFNSDDDRRWVCLHTLRSGSTPARIRALYRLETLPDDPKQPTIPRLVAQALEIEPDEEARLAMLQVLTTRSKLLKDASTYQIRSEFMGRLVTTMTRLGLEVRPPTVWRDPVYTPEIDLMIAQQAFDETSPRVAEAAARSIGRMRSLVGVRHLANEQRRKRPGALQALALVRDEVPELPEVVSAQGRAYAWLANTVRRLTDRPLDLILRFTLALLGGWIAFGQHIYSTYFSIALFTPQRWGNAIAAGLVMGVFVGLLVLVTDEFSQRLRNFWAWWLRLLMASALGIGMGVLTWAAFRWFYSARIPAWDLMRLGGMGLALGFVLVSVTQWPRWRALWLPAALIYFPIALAYPNDCLQDFACAFADGSLWLPAFNYFPVAGIGLAIGLLVGWFIPRKRDGEPLIPLPDRAKIALAGGAGALWCALIWVMYAAVFWQDFITYDHISLWFFGSLVVGLLAAALMGRAQTAAFGGVGLAAFVLLTLTSTQAVFGQIDALGLDYFDPVAFVAPQKELGIDGDRDALLNYLYPPQLLTVGIPMALVIALGAYVQSTYASIAGFIGQPRGKRRTRDAWLTGVLLYAMFMSGFISLFALFSIHVNVWYGLGWSLWGFLTFVAALAAWRWARWGARALLGLGVLLVIGGGVFDVLHILEPLNRSRPAPLLDPAVLLAWGVWSAALGLATVGALRRQLWGGIGLVAVIAAWYGLAILGVLPSFALGLALAHLALVGFALQPHMAEMETGRLRASLASLRPAPAPAPSLTLKAATAPVPAAEPTLIDMPTRARSLETLPLTPETVEVPAEAGVPAGMLATVPLGDEPLAEPAKPVEPSAPTQLDAAPTPAAPRVKIDLGGLK